MEIVLHSAWMVPAATAFVLMMVLGVMSYRRIRQRMSYETWWVAHLYFYLAVALAFGHQIELGPFFIAHPGAAVVLDRALRRGLRPRSSSSRVRPADGAARCKHDLRVAAVVPETDGVVSIYVTGRDLDLLKARGGQFFQWRFMTRDWWWQAHPYSLSASPNSSWLRITVKDLGDQSGAARRLRAGHAGAGAEGPYGVFTAAPAHAERVAAFAAGVGITPIRAMLDDLPDGTDVDARVPRVRCGRPRRCGRSSRRSRCRAAAASGTSRAREPPPDHRRRDPGDGARTSPSCDVYVCGPDRVHGKVLTSARSASRRAVSTTRRSRSDGHARQGPGSTS